MSGSGTEDGAPIILFSSKVGTSAGTSNYRAEDNESLSFIPIGTAIIDTGRSYE